VPHEKAIDIQEKQHAADAHHGDPYNAQLRMAYAIQQMRDAQEEMQKAREEMQKAREGMREAQAAVDAAVNSIARAHHKMDRVVYAEPMPEPLAALSLPGRVREALLRVGIDTVEDVREMDDAACRAIRNFGPHAQAILQEALRQYDDEQSANPRPLSYD